MLYALIRRRLAGAVCCGILAAPILADDAPPPKVKSLDTVHVDAVHSPIDPAMPSVVQTVTAPQLAVRTIINTEDALKYLPSFGIRKRFIGDENATFAVRGTSNTQSARGLVYLDGLLLSNLLGNGFSYPPRWSLVSPDNLERVDVIYGAYSALYPGNSIGATVVMTTRMPDALELSAQSQLFTQHVNEYGVHGNFGGNRLSATLGDRIGAWSFLLGVASLKSNGQPLVFAAQNLATADATAAARAVTGAILDRGPNGQTRVITGINAEGQEATTQHEANLKLAYDITPDVRAGITVGYWQQQLAHRTASFLRDASGAPVYAGVVSIDGKRYVIPASYFAPSSRQSENTLYGLSLGTHRDSGWNVGANASYFDMSKNRDRVADSALMQDGTGQLTAGDGSRWRTFDLRASFTPDVIEPGAHTVSMGYHYDGYALATQSYVLDTWQHGTAGAPIAGTGGSTQTQALYLQDAWQLASRWQLTTGARLEQWRAFDGYRRTATAGVGYDERKETHTSPKASLAFLAGDDVTLRLSVARAYRFPTVSELFQGTFNGIALVNNDPNLKPENDLSRELSTEWTREHGVARFTVYRSDTRDALFSQTNTTVFPTVTNVQNVGRVRSRGAEASWDGSGWWRDALDLSANVAYVQATTVENRLNPASVGKQFYRVPKWRSNLVATYHTSESTSVTVAGRYSGRQYNSLDESDTNPDTFGGVSSFLTFDTRLNWKPTPHLDLGLGVDNLTNRRYFVYYPYPSRTYTLDLKVHL
jgi:iron complex outermembrane receptor protein